MQNLVILGLCLPSSCSKEEIGILMEKVVRDRSLLVSQLYAADFKLVEVSDLTDDHQWLLSGKIILIMYVSRKNAGDRCRDGRARSFVRRFMQN